LNLSRSGRCTVSICVPCYNAGRFVGIAVRSALEQTWQDLEVIVVDDGSTDDSVSSLAEIRDPRLRVIQQDNRGQCAAANRALAVANGRYIKFFDADDVLSRDHVTLQMARLEGQDDCVAMGEWGRFYGDTPEEATFDVLPHYRDSRSVDWLTSDWMNARAMMQCGLWLIPREVLNRSGPWDERLSLINDFEFFARVLSHATKVLYTPGARLFYRSGIPGSLSGRKSRKAVESAFMSLMLGTAHLLKAENSKLTRQACANILQAFDYSYFPHHADLRTQIRARVADLGGADIEPDGPPRFHQLRRVIGWQAARLVQNLVRR
jgi:glycosyltransferase involved in cell wall biosynthesis